MGSCMHMYTKYTRLTMRQGEMCADDTDDANANDGQA